VSAGGTTTTRFARYHDVGIPRSVPPEIASALAGRDYAIQSARLAAGAPARLSDVIEASRAVDSTVVEGWLLERGQQFTVSARDLARLADAGVSARVTDALVAVSNPQTFGVAHGQDDSLALAEGIDAAGRRGVIAYPAGTYDTPWRWGYTPYGYNAYGYNRYGYGAYGYPGFFYGPPVVVVNGRDNAAHGRMVKGQGYSAGSTRSPQPSSSGGSTSRAPSPTPSAPPRTAKPRD